MSNEFDQNANSNALPTTGPASGPGSYTPRSALPDDPYVPQPPGSGYLSVTDALSYLETVRGKPDVYDHFLVIMKDFKNHVTDVPDTMDRVAELFSNDVALIQGFNTFLPDGYRIDCMVDEQDRNIVTITTATGTTTKTVGGSSLPSTARPPGASY